MISYNLVSVDPPPTPPIDWSPLVAGLSIAIITLIVGFTSYQLYFKYPPMVRNIKSLKRKVRKDKRLNPLPVKPRQDIVKTRLRNQMQILRIEPQSESIKRATGKKQIIGMFLLLFIIIFPFMFQFFNLEMIHGNQSSALEGSLRTSAED